MLSFWCDEKSHMVHQLRICTIRCPILKVPLIFSLSVESGSGWQSSCRQLRDPPPLSCPQCGRGWGAWRQLFFMSLLAPIAFGSQTLIDDETTKNWNRLSALDMGFPALCVGWCRIICQGWNLCKKGTFFFLQYRFPKLVNKESFLIILY